MPVLSHMSIVLFISVALIAACGLIYELREQSREPVIYVELPGAQHAFEVFPSLRSLQAIDGVARFAMYVHARSERAQDTTRTEAA